MNIKDQMQLCFTSLRMFPYKLQQGSIPDTDLHVLCVRLFHMAHGCLNIGKCSNKIQTGFIVFPLVF